MNNEPVGYFYVNDYGDWQEDSSGQGTPLYTHPAKTLTDEEIIDIWLPFATDGIKGKIAFARAILRKAQEK